MMKYIFLGLLGFTSLCIGGFCAEEDRFHKPSHKNMDDIWIEIKENGKKQEEMAEILREISDLLHTYRLEMLGEEMVQPALSSD